MTTYRRESGIAEVQGPDRVTLLLVREPGSLPVAITGSGTSVWEELGSGPRELEQLVSAVAERFQVTESLVKSDVRGLCRQLVQAGFLVPGDDDEGRSSR
jgi:Coenzyme PQQ synthesis protein D (PqqD)